MSLSESELNKLIENYKVVRDKYDTFTKKTEEVLKQLLSGANLQFAYIKGRTKEVEPLQNKIKKLETDGMYFKKFTELDDLSGCRIVLYLQSDVSECSAFLYKAFGRENVLKSKLKYKQDDNGYEAQYFILKINGKSKFATDFGLEIFEGMKLEVQVTTVLFDTWAFIAHNTVYKPDRKIATFDEKVLEVVQKELSDLVEKHIRPMNTSFEFIRALINKAQQGTLVFDSQFLGQLTSSDSNNDIYQNLGTLKQQLEEFGDKSSDKIKVVDVIKKVLEKSKTNKQRRALTDFGYFPGFDYDDIQKKCIEILGLGHIRYIYPLEILDITLELERNNHKKYQTDTELKRLFEDFSRYHLMAIKKIGLSHQEKIIRYFEEKSDEYLIKNIHGFCYLLPKMFEPSFEGTEMKNYQTFSLQFGPLNVTPSLIKLRSRMIGQCLRLFSLTKKYEYQKEVFVTLLNALRFPIHGDYKEDMVSMIFNDAFTISDYIKANIKEIDYKLLREIEDDFERLLTHKMIDKTQTKKVKSFINLLNSDDNYKFFKLFYGYDHDYSDNKGWRLLESQRQKRIASVLKKINQGTVKTWGIKIIKVADNYSQLDFGKYQFYKEFLFQLGKTKPKVAMVLMDKYEKKFGEFLTQLVSGVLLSKHKNLAIKKIKIWIKKRNHLDVISQLPFYTRVIDSKVTKQLLSVAKKAKRSKVINQIARACTLEYDGTEVVKNIFIDAIKTLNKQNKSLWINYYSSNDKVSVFEDLNEEETQHVLDNLLKLKGIDHNSEEILTDISKKNPLDVVKFFFRRLEQKSKYKNYLDYDAIPYDFYSLSEELAKHSGEILPEIYEWFKSNNTVIKYEAGGFLKKIFLKDFSILNSYLLALLDKKELSETDFEAIIFTFRAYNGEITLHPLYQKIISKIPLFYPPNKVNDWYQELRASLSQTGVVSGEYGLVEAYKRKIEEISPWFSNSDINVKKFAKQYKNDLEGTIPYEIRSTDADLNMMKKEYGE